MLLNLPITQTLNEISLHERLFAVVLPVRIEMVNRLLEIKLFIRRVSGGKTEKVDAYNRNKQQNKTVQNVHCELSRLINTKPFLSFNSRLVFVYKLI